MTTTEYLVDSDVTDAAVTAIEETLARFGLLLSEPDWCDMNNDLKSVIREIHVMEDK